MMTRSASDTAKGAENGRGGSGKVGVPKFYTLPAVIASSRGLRPAAKIVWAILRNRQGDNASCWPSVRRIAMDAGLNLTPTVSAIRDLEAAGLLVVDRTSHNHHYVVLETGTIVPKTGTFRKPEPRRSGNRNHVVPEIGTELDPRTISSNYTQVAPPVEVIGAKPRDPTPKPAPLSARDAIAIFIDAYREARGTNPDRPTGRAAGVLRRWLVSNSTDPATWTARVRLAVGLGGKPPWPFGRPGELTIDNITRHWLKLGDALIGESHNDTDGNRVRPEPGKYAAFN